jgi:hypothetical protein
LLKERSAAVIGPGPQIGGTAIGLVSVVGGGVGWWWRLIFRLEIDKQEIGKEFWIDSRLFCRLFELS